jgi:hypothetical protein
MEAVFVRTQHALPATLPLPIVQIVLTLSWALLLSVPPASLDFTLFVLYASGAHRIVLPAEAMEYASHAPILSKSFLAHVPAIMPRHYGNLQANAKPALHFTPIVSHVSRIPASLRM